MTSPSNHVKDRFDQIAEQYKDAVAEAVSGWSDALQRLSTPTDTTPTATAIVDTLFDLAELQLKRDREFTKGVLALVDRNTSPATETVTDAPAAAPVAPATPVAPAAASRTKATPATK